MQVIYAYCMIYTMLLQMKNRLQSEVCRCTSQWSWNEVVNSWRSTLLQSDLGFQRTTPSRKATRMSSYSMMSSVTAVVSKILSNSHIHSDSLPFSLLWKSYKRTNLPISGSSELTERRPNPPNGNVVPPYQNKFSENQVKHATICRCFMDRNILLSLVESFQVRDEIFIMSNLSLSMPFLLLIVMDSGGKWTVYHLSLLPLDVPKGFP